MCIIHFHVVISIARIGDIQDFDDRVEFIPEKKYVDDEKNRIGEYLLDFLKDDKSCVLNRRGHTTKDDYTYVSTTVKSVVDYMVVPNNEIQKYSK